MDATKGILLIAIGHIDYLRMAENLAISLKHIESGIQICLAHNYSEEINKNLFDKEVIVPKESYNTNGKVEFIKIKTWMYDLSPFEKTIFLDVDMVWLFNRKPSELFDECKELNWTMSNTGIAESSVWCDIKELNKLYPNKKMWNYHSECVYFEKSKETKKYFDRVKFVYENPPLNGTNFGGARIADELAFQIASMELNEYPHKQNWTPIFWYARDKQTAHLQPYKLSQEYFAYSVGGNKLPITIKSNYSLISNYHCQKTKLGKPYKIKDKRSIIPERMKI